MGTGTGLTSQFMLKREGTPGTPETPDIAVPFVKEGIKQSRTQHVSEGIVAGRVLPDVKQVKYGMRRVAGPLEMEVYAQSQGIFWKGVLGTCVDAGAGPYTHTCSPGGTLPSHTGQVGMKDTGDTTRARTYAGLKFNGFTLSGQKDQIGKLTIDCVGHVAENLGTSMAVAAYATNAMVPMLFTEGSVTVDGATVNCEAFELKGDNKLYTRDHAGNIITKPPLRGGRMEVSGKATIELEDLTEYNLYVNGTGIDIVLGFTDGTYSTIVTVHTKLTGDTPTVNGTGPNLFDITWAGAFGDGTDADGLTVVYTDATATA
jgi:hypothetical protein